jgi:hypothetical protein
LSKVEKLARFVAAAVAALVTGVVLIAPGMAADVAGANDLVVVVGVVMPFAVTAVVVAVVLGVTGVAVAMVMVAPMFVEALEVIH